MPLSIAENLSTVRNKIAQAAKKAGREESDIQLVAVSKTKPSEAVAQAYAAGQRVFGENRVAEALSKMENCPADISWHFIGHLQTNKARQIPGAFSCVQSVDSVRLAQSLSHGITKVADTTKSAQKLEILLQVNWSGEETKAGVKTWEELATLAETALSLPQLEVKGLMTIPDPTFDEKQTRGYFGEMRMLLEKLNQTFSLELRELSMGMSHDYLWAVEEGATLVRVGSAIFGDRS